MISALSNCRDALSRPPILWAVRCVARSSLVVLSVLVCVVPPQNRALSAEAQGRGPVSVVATGVADDATTSNNQVKVVRASAGLLVAYVGMAGGSPQVFLAASHDNGARWTLLTQVSSGPPPSRLPTLALDAAGRLHVIWTRYDDGVGKIYYRVWTGRWTQPQARISPSPGYAGYPALALDRAGAPQVLWYGIRAGAPASTRHGSIYEIFYTGYDGRAWSPPLLISAGLPDSINPAIGADPAGRLHAVWYQFDGRTYQVRYAERDGIWSPPRWVSRSQSDEFNPDLAVDPAGQVSLVWEHHDAQASTIYYARRSRRGWDGPVALSLGASPAHHPSVAVTARGDVYVAWDQDDGHLYVRRSTGRWEPIVRLTSSGGNTFPTLSADGADVDAAWTHTESAQSAVYFVRIVGR